MVEGRDAIYKEFLFKDFNQVGMQQVLICKFDEKKNLNSIHFLVEK